MITELTPEQEAALPRYVEKWMTIGLSTEETDFNKAKKAITKAYEIAGYAVPPDENWLLFDSPKQALDDERLKGKLRLGSFVYGNQDASWLSYYEFFQKECGLKLDPGLDPLIELANHCCWWAPFEKAVIMTHRPKLINLDENNQLHSETEAAIEFRDGHAIYAWHGQHIPDHWITDKENLSVTEALSNPNTELRRCAAEIIGWERVIDELDCKTIDKHPNPEIGELVVADLPDNGPQHFIKVKCGTGRTFALLMPAQDDNGNPIVTALQAQVWLNHNMFTGEQLETLRRT